MSDVIASFERRAAYFSEESTWASSAELKALIAELVLRNTSGQTESPEILDYGAGDGQVAAELARRGAIVDVADVSESMLQQCSMARRRYNPDREGIDRKYDAVVLRQVLQYVEESEWADFVSRILSYLKPGGFLLFSQIVPYCSVDYEFWRSLVSVRRKARMSLPTENEFLPLLEQVGGTPAGFVRSTTRQSLRAWIEKEDPVVQAAVRNVLESRSAAVSALWDFEKAHDGDLNWRNNWVHIIVKTSQHV